MIKQDLIQRVVERTGLPRTKAESAVDAIFDSMKQTLIAGDRIELRGFGVRVWPTRSRTLRRVLSPSVVISLVK